MLLEIIHAEYLGDYRMYLAFNDGRVGEADLRALISERPQSVMGLFARRGNVERMKPNYVPNGIMQEAI